MAKERNKRNHRNSKIIIRRGKKDMANKGSAAKTVGCGCTTVRGTSIKATTKGVISVPATQRPGVNWKRPVTVVTPQPSFWETDIEDVMISSCGAYDDKVTVSISPLARAKMTSLMDKFTRIEWLAYLIGDKENNIVTDIVIPKQRVTSVNVYVDEPVDVPIIGVIHSHHDMGNNFSHTDDDYINQNHDLSLCITNTKITGQIRVKTDCGKFFMADVECVDSVDGFDKADFMKDVNLKISEINHMAGAIGGYRGRGISSPLAGQHHIDTYDDYGFGLEMSDTAWYTDPASGIGHSVPEARDLLEEIELYTNSIRGVAVDEGYRSEFNLLIGFIESIGKPTFDAWETKAFDPPEAVFTEDYYRLIDEISLCSENITQMERMSVKGLAVLLEKMLETTTPRSN